jgi:hypothetical protein
MPSVVCASVRDRASAYFEGDRDEPEFSEWRRKQHVTIGHDVWTHKAVRRALPELRRLNAEKFLTEYEIQALEALTR